LKDVIQVIATQHILMNKINNMLAGGVYNMLCECGCPINLKPYKGGESTIDILQFAADSLKVITYNN
jgi:hypothetical protein